MKEGVDYGYYLVCMMDLLGQKEMYKTLESFPSQVDSENPEFVKALVSFIRSIEYFKRDVDSFLGGVEKYQSKHVFPPNSLGFVSKTRNKTYKVQRFSDGIMIYVPLASDKNSLPISSVTTALLCTASTMLISLAKGNPIRVGIAVGGGVELEDGELFGPAIGHAHEMENKRAIYPRIAIHENLISYLNSHMPSGNADKLSVEEKFEYGMAKLCKSLIKLDNDGEYILDYLENGDWDKVLKEGDSNPIVQAFKFIKSQKKQFESEGNEKLIKKYSYLYQYFIDSRHGIFKDS